MTGRAGPRIRVTYLIATLEPAGAEKQLVTVAAAVDRTRFDPRVVCLTRRGPLEVGLRAAGVPVDLVGKRHKLGLLAYHRLRARLRAEPPDILHTWMFTSNLYGRLAALGLPIRTVASEVVADPGKEAWRLAVDRLLARRTSAFYVNSRAVARFYHERCGIPLARMTVIPNGVDVRPVEALPRATLGVPPHAYLVCCVGRLEPQKALDRVIDALASDGLRERDVVLVIAGEGPSRRGLDARVARLGLGGRVRLLGHRDDVPRILAAADLFVLPSLFEGMPNALMEAMAQGLPCVATAVGGVEELLGESEAGLVVPRSDPALLAEAIRTLMDAPDRAAALGRAARERVAARFSIDRNVAAFEALYAAVMAGG